MNHSSRVFVYTLALYPSIVRSSTFESSDPFSPTSMSIYIYFYGQSCSTQAALSMGFSRQEYWDVLPYPPPGDLLDPGIKPGSPALQADLYH